MTKTKAIGYAILLAGVIAIVIGLARIVHTDLTDAALIGIGAIAGGAGYYVAKKWGE